jgi:hypothetical protein
MKTKPQLEPIVLIGATMRKLTEHDVEFTLDHTPDRTPIHGNAMASGDPEVDHEAEQWIYAELARGNDWAWCEVRVTARWRMWVGADYLGACSYLNEEDFRRAGGYFADMKARALDDLNEQISEAYKALQSLVGG